MTQLSRSQRLDLLNKVVRQSCAEIARELWQMGQALREVQRDELWRDAGYGGFDAWLEGSQLVGKSTAYKAMRVAEQFGEEMAVRFGTEKLNATLGYLSATGKDEKPGDVMALKVRVRGQDGTWTTVPFVEASASQIRQAVQNVRASQRQAGLPADLRKRAEGLNRDVPKAQPQFRSSRLKVHQDRSGQVLVSVQGVPLEHFEAYVAEVRARLLGG